LAAISDDLGASRSFRESREKFRSFSTFSAFSQNIRVFQIFSDFSNGARITRAELVICARYVAIAGQTRGFITHQCIGVGKHAIGRKKPTGAGTPAERACRMQA
jgi:hypothetical protein